MTRMKQYFDSSIKPMSFADGEKVLVYNPKKKKGHFAKWSVTWLGPYTVQRKLNSANYVIRRGKGKSVVIHVDRMRKLPISSLDESESSVDQPTDVNTHASEDKETSVLPSKRRKLQPATDVPTSRDADSSPADESDNNDSSVCAADISSDTPAVTNDAAAEGEAANTDRGSRSALDLATGSSLRAISRPRRRHRKPARLLDRISASSFPIGRFVGHCSVTARPDCRLAFTQTPCQPAAQTRTRADVGTAVVVSTVHMSKKRCIMSDVEPSSSDDERGADHGDRPPRNIDGQRPLRNGWLVLTGSASACRRPF